MSTDPRQLRTRAALTDALLRLIEREHLAAISISELCEEAGVHRTTFYKHATSIEEFAVDVITSALDQLATVTAESDDPGEEYLQAMVDVLAHVAVERQLFRPLLASKWSSALRLAIDQRMQDRARLALEVFESQLGVEVPDNRDEVVAFVSGGLVGAIVHWAMSDELDAEAGAARVQALMPRWWPVR